MDAESDVRADGQGPTGQGTTDKSRDTLQERALVAAAVRNGDFETAASIAQMRQLGKRVAELEQLREEVRSYGERLEETLH